MKQRQQNPKSNASKLNIVFKLKRGSQPANQTEKSLPGNPTEKSLPSSIDICHHQQLDHTYLQRLMHNQNQLNTLLKAILEHTQLKSPHQPTPSQLDEEHLLISNLDSKNKMHHGQQFTHMLDQRDVTLEHDFDFGLKIHSEDIKLKGFLHSQTYQDLCASIRQFLVETLANVLSVSFNSLNHDKLGEKEVKNYAASNILFNVQSVYTKTIAALEGSATLKNLQIDLEQAKADLVSQLEPTLKTILVNLADHYPQAPVTGGTLRMKRAIHEVNRVDDEENDLIYANAIRIDKYLAITNEKAYMTIEHEKIQYGEQIEKVHLREDHNYTEFIMEVVNAAIRTAHALDNDARERTNKEIFTEFNKELFWLSQDPSFKALVEMAANPKATDLKHLKRTVCSFFERITETNPQALRAIDERILETSTPKPSPRKDSADEPAKPLPTLPTLLEPGDKLERQSARSLCGQIQTKRQKSLEQLSNYAISFKIPNQVKMFNRQEQSDKKFTAKHSSVLRILTKWAESLEDIFDHPQTHVLMRLYSFKDIHNNLINLARPDKEVLVDNLRFEAAEVRNHLELIKARNHRLISQVLARQTHSFASSVFRFSETRAASSKINAILTSLMVQYLNVLVHHLLKAGEITLGQESSTLHLNLLVFRVYDLMRAKLMCSESSFITLLRTLYLLDESDAMEGKFNLVRIKNKLEDPANNVMVNYMFMGKVVCELQLSIQQSTGKQKHYELFSHFIYELTRGNFGVLSECAVMVSQLDPLVNSCDKVYYEEKTPKLKPPGDPEPRSEEPQPIFYCEHCQRLVINENLQLLNSQQKQKCLKCLIDEEQSDKTINLITFKLKQDLEQHLAENNLLKAKNYQELAISKEKFQTLLRLDANAQLEFAIVIFVKSELQHFMVKITPQTIQKMLQTQKQIDFPSEIDYMNISKAIKDKRKINDHFLFKILNEQTLVQILSKMEFKPQKLLSHIQCFAENFEQFRTEKNVIKSIKFKGEIINCNDDQAKWNCFEKVLQLYSVQPPEHRERLLDQHLKYKKYGNLEFEKIKFVQAKTCNITNISQLIHQCTNIEQLILANNHILDIQCLNNKKKMTKLDLQNNQIQTLEGLQNMRSIQRLQLSSNNLQNVDGLRNVTHINTLNLTKNKLENVDGLSNIKTLSTLVLNKNMLKSVDGLKNIVTMQKLQINENPLQNVDGLCNLTSIRELDLFSNQLQSITGLQNLKSIDRLYLNNNFLTNVDGLQNLTSIKELQLDNNQLVNLDGLRNLTTIDTLQLNENKLKNVNGLQALKNIKQLYLQNNELENIDGLRNITNIHTLQLNENRLREVQGLRSMDSAKYLYLFNNQLENVDGLQNLVNVKELQLHNNCLSNVHGLKNITTIKSLKLYNNQLQNVEGLSNMVSVKSLKLHNNQLTTVHGLRNISSIKELCLHQNLLDNLDGLANINTIDTLQANHNRLTNLDALCNLTSIQTLDLSHNQLTNVDALINLTTISKLNLAHNRLINVDGLKSITAIDTLNLAQNQLQNMDGLKKMTSIRKLHLQRNSSLKVSVLLSSLELLSVDFAQLYKFDFKDITNLKILFCDSQNRCDFKRLSTQTELKKIEERKEYQDY